MRRRRYSFWGPLHQENKWNHYQSRQAQQPEIVEVRDHGRLSENEPVQLPVRLLLRGNGAARREALTHALHRVVELIAVCRRVSCQRGLVKLGAAGQHRGDEGNADACADVARQINQP